MVERSAPWTDGPGFPVFRKNLDIDLMSVKITNIIFLFIKLSIL